MEGRGVEADTITAIEYFEKSANNGNLYGQRNLAYKYKYGIGVKKDIKKAIYWFEKSAGHNDEDSYEELIYACYSIKDYNSLFKYVKKGSELNYKACLNTLAYCYAKGEGTDVDFKKAIETIDHAISIFPNEANLYDSKGEILMLKGKKRDAKKMWEKVNEIDPQFYKENDSKLNKFVKSD